MGWFEEQLEVRRKSDQKILEDSFIKLTDVLLGERVASRMHDECIVSQGTIDEILKYYHYRPVKAPDSITSAMERLDYCLKPYGLMRRNVELTEGWYKDAIGPLIAHKKGETAPIALLPGKGVSKYYYNDRDTGEQIWIDRKRAQEMETDAICFYKSLPMRRLGLMDLIHYMRGCINLNDRFMLVLSAFVVTLIGLMLPSVTRALTGPVLSSGRTDALVGILVCILCVSVSSQLFGIIKALLKHRLTVKMGTSVMAAMIMRMISLPASFFRRYSPGELRSRVMSVTELCMVLMGVVMSASVLSLTSLLYVVQIFHFAPVLVIPSVIIISATIAFSILVTQVRIRRNKKQMEQAAVESGMTYSLISGVQKIKLTGSEKRVFGKWLDFYVEGVNLKYNLPLVLRISKPDRNALTDMVASTNAAHGKVILLSAEAASRENVRFLQSLASTVWAQTPTDTRTIMTMYTNGVNGVVVDDYEAALRAESFFRDDAPSLLRAPLIIGHRGDPSTYVENTLDSARGAFEEGVDSVENDIQLSADGEVFILHDDTTERLLNFIRRDEEGEIYPAEHFTLKQLQAQPFDWESIIDWNEVLPGESSRYGTLYGQEEQKTYRIPTLREYIEAFKGTGLVHDTEIKSYNPAIIPAYKALVDEYDAWDQFFTITFNTQILDAIYSDYPQISIGALNLGEWMDLDSEGLEGTELTQAKLRGLFEVLDAWNATYNPIYMHSHEEALQAARHRGLTVWPWTYRIDYGAEDFARDYLRGYAGLTCDYPWVASDYIVEIEARDSVVASIDDIPSPTGRTQSGEERVLADAEPVLLETLPEGQSLVLWRYRAELDVNGTGYGHYYLYSNPFMVSVQPQNPLTFIRQPRDVVVQSGEDVSFSVEVGGGRQPYAYQWQIWDEKRGKWVDLPGFTDSVMSRDDVEKKWNGCRFRCVVADAAGIRTISLEVTLTVRDRIPTGDNSNLPLYLAVAMAALALLILLRRKAEKA